MKYTLVENARDSLQIAIDFFYYSNDDYDGLGSEKFEFRNVKIALAFLENAIELFLKMIISSSDPTRIYRTNDSSIFEEVKKKIEGNPLLSFDDVMIKQKDTRTITYSEALRIFCTEYNQSPKVRQILEELGRLRNCVTHLGIDESDNLEELYFIFNAAFGIILYVFYPYISKVDDYYKNYNDIIDMVEPFVETDFFYSFDMRAKDTEEEFWRVFFSAITVLENREFFESEDILHSIEAMPKIREDGYYLGFWVEFEHTIGECEYIAGFRSEYLRLENATIVIEPEGNLVYFAYLHETNDLVRFKHATCFQFDIDCDDYFHWNLDSALQHGIRYKMSLDTMILIITETLMEEKACVCLEKSSQD